MEDIFEEIDKELHLEAIFGHEDKCHFSLKNERMTIDKRQLKSQKTQSDVSNNGSTGTSKIDGWN